MGGDVIVWNARSSHFPVPYACLPWTAASSRHAVPRCAASHLPAHGAASWRRRCAAAAASPTRPPPTTARAAPRPRPPLAQAFAPGSHPGCAPPASCTSHSSCQTGKTAWRLRQLGGGSGGGGWGGTATRVDRWAAGPRRGGAPTPPITDQSTMPPLCRLPGPLRLCCAPAPAPHPGRSPSRSGA